MTAPVWTMRRVLRDAFALTIALAGVLTLGAGGALATHVVCGQLLTQSVTLDSDLNCLPGQDGLVIGADNITVNLNGHTIDGTDNVVSGDDDGIDNSAGYDNLTVRGGTIKEFDDGIRTATGVDGGATNVLLTELTMRDNDGAFDISDTTNSVFSRSTITNDSAVNAVFSGATGIELNNSNNNVIRRNRIANYPDGVDLDTSHNNRIVGNNVTGSTFEATSEAIELDDSNGNTITSNIATANVGGIDAENSANLRVEQNALRTNSANGIELDNADNAIVRRNRSSGNGMDGIALDTGTDGALDPSSAVLLVRNVASTNADDGLDVDTPGHTLTENEANRNGDWGIEAVAGTIDGGENEASGNGQAAQCQQVNC